MPPIYPRPGMSYDPLRIVKDGRITQSAAAGSFTSLSMVSTVQPSLGQFNPVGAAQDLAELDIDLAAITQAGGWKSPRMPLQYAEKINAARSGMARAAAATGRDQPVSEEG
jgi:hypothetical protein